MTRFILLLLFVSGGLQLQAQSDKAQIQKCYENYLAAILSDSGQLAVTYVDSRTITYYDQMLELVKHADSLAIDSLGIGDKFLVLTVRHRAPMDQIQAMKNGRDLFAYAVDNGMVGKSNASTNSIDSIAVKGNFAKAAVISKGKSTGAYYRFYKEDGAWKLNLTALLPMTDAALRKMAKEGGYSDNEFVVALLELTSRRAVPASVWQVPK